MHLSRRLIIAVLLIASQLVQAGETVSPAAVIERFNVVLVDVMQHADELGFAGRYKRLEPVIRSSFDFQTIIRIICGKHWRELDDRQKNTLANTFSRLSIATYAYQFDRYSGQRFETISEKQLTGNRAAVRVAMHKKNGDIVQFDYALIQEGDAWFIVNVTANGVSDLALKRVEYGRVLDKEGFDSLIVKLQEKIDFYSDSEKKVSS